MKRRNFIRNTGFGIAGLALSNSIYGKDLSTRKSLNVFILMSSLIKLSQVPEDIQEKVLYLSQRKVKELPSISSRAIFKYVDLIEKTEEADL